jgi:hypothetical protein
MQFDITANEQHIRFPASGTIDIPLERPFEFHTDEGKPINPERGGVVTPSRSSPTMPDVRVTLSGEPLDLNITATDYAKSTDIPPPGFVRDCPPGNEGEVCIPLDTPMEVIRRYEFENYGIGPHTEASRAYYGEWFVINYHIEIAIPGIQSGSSDSAVLAQNFTRPLAPVDALIPAPTSPAQLLSANIQVPVEEGEVGTSVYKDSKRGIQVEIPSDWTRIELKNSLVEKGAPIRNIIGFVAPPELEGGIKGVDEVTFEFEPSLILAVENLEDKKMTLDQYTKQHLQYLGKIANEVNATEIEFDSPVNSKTGPNQLKVMTFSPTEEQKIMQAWMVKNGKAYIVTYSSPAEEFQEFLPIMQKAFDSFRITR